MDASEVLDVSEDQEMQEIEVGLNDIQDTVGAVAYHSEGGMAAGVSSGGLLLKWPGRVGEVNIFARL